jgi:hypothetical protein
VAPTLTRRLARNVGATVRRTLQEAICDYLGLDVQPTGRRRAAVKPARLAAPRRRAPDPAAARLEALKRFVAGTGPNPDARPATRKPRAR